MKKDKKVLQLNTIGNGEIIQYAACELVKYIERLTSGNITVNVSREGEFDIKRIDELWLGICSDFGHECSIIQSSLDDAVSIKTIKGRGILAGSNQRSVLLAVYRFLEEAGCRWVRPGTDGEYIPQIDIDAMSVSLEEKASYRHRGICIEGAVSYENVADLIEWMPKVGMNSYFIQFREAHTFFDRWYSHLQNPTLEPEPFTVEKAREYVELLEAQMAKRGILFHAVGHGWTCEPLGIPCLGWDKVDLELSPLYIGYLAEVNGERSFWGGVPLNTNLCYSNPEIRNIMNKDIAQYLEQHSNVDLLHFWLADGFNNQCECEKCEKAIPSDFYIDMLNELDELLTEKGLSTKIVFLIYLDLMWPPENKRIKNPDRFVLMFAPITRRYDQSFSAKSDLPQMPGYVRNKLRFPDSVEENIVFLKEWQKIFKGDSFDFDYHFMWDHYIDQGYCNIAKVLSEDIKNLKNLGLNGLISCQVQRAFFPTGFGMYVMGKTLWDAQLTYEQLAEEYFKSAFGQDGILCKNYMEELSSLFDMQYIKGEKPFISKESADNFSKIPKLVDDFRAVIVKNQEIGNDCVVTSWKYLKYHSNICSLMGQALQYNALGHKDMVEILWDSIEKYVQKHEPELQSVLDVFDFVGIVGLKYKMLMKNKKYDLVAPV